MVVAPMAIYQASTISTDTISNGIGFLFVSGCLFMADRKQIRWKEWLILVLLFFLLFSAKLNLVILAVLPFIILTPSRFKMKRGFLWLGIATCIAIAARSRRVEYPCVYTPGYCPVYRKSNWAGHANSHPSIFNDNGPDF